MSSLLPSATRVRISAITRALNESMWAYPETNRSKHAKARKQRAIAKRRK